MSNVSNESPSAEGYALAVSTVSTTPINLSINNASAFNASSWLERLPREVLSEIFLHYIASNEYGILDLRHEYGILDRRHGCWTLLSVCRSWNDMVTTTPSLWRDIRVQVRCLDACRDPVAVLSLILSRAGKAGLFVEFDASSTESYMNGNVPRHSDYLALDLLAVFVKHSTQWRTVKLFGLDADSMYALRDIRDRIPQLLDLDIRSQYKVSLENISSFNAPQLERWCFFSCAAEGLELGRLPFQHQLTNFEMEGVVYNSSLVDVLRDCQHLEDLRAHFRLRSPPVDARVTSQLTHLNLKDFLDDLALVHLPNLCLLTIGNRRERSLAVVVPALLRLLKYSRCPLASLELISCNVEGLAGVLELVPLLGKLIITLGGLLPCRSAPFIAALDETLSKLMTDLGKVDLVPKLEHFGIHMNMPKNTLTQEMTFFKPKEVKEMLSRRVKHNGMEWYIFFIWDVVYLGENHWGDEDDDDEE